MKVALARRLNEALSGIDTAKTELAQACQTGSDHDVEAAGDRYEDAREEMAETMQALTEAAGGAPRPPADGDGS